MISDADLARLREEPDELTNHLRVLWKKGRNMYASFFTELDAVRRELGDEKFVDWCSQELHMSILSLHQASGLLRGEDTKRVRADLSGARRIEVARRARRK